MVAVLATAAAVLATSQASSGVEAPTGTPARSTVAAAGDPTSPGVNDVASATAGSTTPAGAADPMISGDGRWDIFSSTANLQPGSPGANPGTGNVFVRDLRNGTTTLLSIGSGDGLPEPATGASFLPSISDDGRYVSYLTRATDIVPTTGTGPLTLVLCNRDPDSDGVFDEIDPDGNLTNVCVSVYSNASGTGAGSINPNDRPALAGFANRIAWTENTGDSFTHVWSAPFTFTAGVLTPGAPVQLPMNLGNPDSTACGVRPADGRTLESQPAITDNASEIVATVEFAWGSFCSAIVGTNNLSSPAFATSTRYDLIPSGCGTGFLGDRHPLTGSCAAGTGGSDKAVESPSVDEFANHVLFRYHDGPTPGPGFAAPRGAAPTTNTDWMVLTTSEFSDVSAQVISRDNAGTPVNSIAGAISEDGRYVAFSTSAPNAHDGQDLSSGTNEQVVARDLTVDRDRASALQPRLPGALVTPRDPARSTPANCTPAAGQSCASAGGAVGSISIDGTGARVSYLSSATDLVPADSAVPAAYVRTWQPQPVAATTNFGTVQTGANKVVDVPIGLSGFGPLTQITTSLGGADSADFTVVGQNCTNAVLHVDDPCTVTVRFAPSSNGPKSARLQLTSPQLAAPAPAAGLAGRGGATGPRNAAADTVRASLQPNGAQAAEGGNQSMVSGDGRWDVFVSRSDLTRRDLTPTNPNDDHSNVYVRDLADPQTTVQISLHSAVAANPDAASRPVATAGHPTGTNPNGDSFSPTISSDGRFVSFLTSATDVVPPRFFGPHPPSLRPDFTIVVCDRDPSGTKDAAGQPVLDRPRAGTSVPDYVCFPVQSGVFNDNGRSVDTNSRPNLSGDGTRIAYVETDDNAPDSRRVETADLSAPGGRLHAPSGFAFVPSTVPGFEHDSNRADETGVEQTQPVLNEDGTKVVYEAVQHFFEGVAHFAVIERNLAAGTDLRVDDLNDPAAPTIQIDDAPAVSDDGNRVAFSYVDPAVDSPRVFVTTIVGTTATSDLVSRNNSGDPAEATEPALSGDGRYLAFRAQASDMHNGVDPPDGHCNNQFEQDLHVVCEIVARDLVRDAQRAAANLPREDSELVSTSIAKCVANPPAGRLCGGNNDAANPSMDNTGSEVGFDTAADDIVPGDTNVDDGEGGPFPVTDAFVHTWRPTVVTPTLNFGSVRVGASRTRTFLARIQDFGGTPVAFGPISLGTSSIVGLNHGDYHLVSTTCTGSTLHAGPPDGQPIGTAPESCRFKIRFTPTRAGTRKATLQANEGKDGFPRHNPNRTIFFDPPLVRTLTGVGTTAAPPTTPAIAVTPTSLNFGTRLPEETHPLTKTVTVTSSGSAPLVISGVVVNDTTHPGAAGDYSVNASDCLGTTAPGASCVIRVTFRDSRVGVRDAVLVISHNAAGGSTSVTLLARTNKPKVESNPAVSAVQRVITISGTGFAPSHEVEVGFDHNVQTTMTTTANGSFELQMVVLANGPQGPRTLFGHSTGFDKSIAGDFPFLVVLGSSDPGGSVVIRD